MLSTHESPDYPPAAQNGVPTFGSGERLHAQQPLRYVDASWSFATMVRLEDTPGEYRGIAITAYRPFFAHPRMPRANIRYIAKAESFVCWSDSWPKLKEYIDKRLDGN
jgi:hypothetical protein